MNPKPNATIAVPLRVRDACVVALEALIPEIVELARSNTATPTIKLSAFDKLGKFGLAGRKTVLVENPTVAQICLETVVDLFHPTEAQLAIFNDRLGEALHQLEGADPEEDEEDRSDD